MSEKFTQNFVEKIETDGMYFDSRVVGLIFRKRGPARSWFFRRKISGKQKMIGLGALKRISLVQARSQASKLQSMTNEEFLLFIENRKNKAATPEESKKPLTFRDVANQFENWNLEMGKWKELDKGHRVYLSRMKCHILPVLGDKIFDDITVEDIAQIAKNLQDKSDTLDRVLNRILKLLFNWARAKKLYSHDNPADKSGALQFLLPPPKFKSSNRGALSVAELPDFMKELYEHLGESYSFRCGFFAVLTATRSQTARMAKWSQIDFEEQVWTIPPSQLKVSDNGYLVVPLADEVIEFLRRIPRKEECDLIFPNQKNVVMSDTIFSRVVRNLPTKWIDTEQSKNTEREVLATMHGIARATFRTWSQDDSLGNDKKFDARIAELCLHHKIQDAYNGAYERNQSFIRRRELMEEWAKFCFSKIKPD